MPLISFCPSCGLIEPFTITNPGISPLKVMRPLPLTDIDVIFDIPEAPKVTVPVTEKPSGALLVPVCPATNMNGLSPVIALPDEPVRFPPIFTTDEPAFRTPSRIASPDTVRA